MIKRMIKGHPTRSMPRQARESLGLTMIKAHPTESRMPRRALSGYRPTTWIGTVSERLAGRRREQPPGSGHSLELMLLSVIEADVGADEQVFHRARDQHLTVAGERRNPGRDVDG